MNNDFQTFAKFIPARISSRQGRARIDWVQASCSELVEPFYHQTINSLISGDKHRATKTSSIDILHQFDSLEQIEPPSAFIFHMSRCGSTLLTNALKTLRGAICVSEAEILTQLLKPKGLEDWNETGVGDVSPIETQEWNAKRENLLRGAINIFGQRASDSESTLIIKFTSWNCLFIRVLKSIFPNVPRLFVYRNPLDVMVSNLIRKPRWWSLRSNQAAFATYFNTNVQTADLSDEEFCAFCIESFCKAMKEEFDQKTRLIRYESIDASEIKNIASFIKIANARIDTSRLQECLTIYSKDPSQQYKFSPDHHLKQAQATSSTRECSNRILDPIVAELDHLEARRRNKSSSHLVSQSKF